MKAKAIIISVVALLAIGMGVVFAVVNQNNSQDQSGSTNNSERTSIANLLAQNKNLVCTYNYTGNDGNKSSGTAYIAGERMRGSFAIDNAQQAEQKSELLRDDQYQYIWDGQTNTGLKMDTSTIGADTDYNETSAQPSIDQNQEYDFDCSDWRVDESLFQVPDNVTFTDYTAQIEQLQQLQQGAGQDYQVTCSTISDPAARAACEKAL
jgi:hypothetical protein